MKNKGGANHFFIALGIVSIGLSAFVGLFSSIAYLGIAAGIFLIWAAFPEKIREKAEAVEEKIDPTASQPHIGMSFER